MKWELVSNFPVNTRNSCFLDSVFVAMFLEPQLHTTSMFLANILTKETDYLVYGDTPQQNLQHRKKIQQSLVSAVRSMRQNEPCDLSEFRSLMGQCNFQSNFDDGKQHDAVEFLQCLCKVFSVEKGINQMHREVYGSHDTKSVLATDLVKTSDTFDPIGIVYNAHTWKNGDSVRSVLVQRHDHLLDEDNKFSEHNFTRMYTLETFIPAYYFAVHIERSAREEIHKDMIWIEENLVIGKRSYSLKSLVLHLGQSVHSGHYVSLIKKNGKLYLYDNLCSNIRDNPYDAEFIGKHCVLIFYCI